MFIAALFTIAMTWKQPRCPSADEWIRKLWYIYTKKYYSAIKKNAFESVLMSWSWNSNTLATWCEELMHWKRPWCWKRLRAGEEGDDRGWDGWMASPTRWTWVWASSGSWRWTGMPGVLESMGPQRLGHNWGTELNWMRWVKLQPIIQSEVSQKEKHQYSILAHIYGI